MPKKKRPQPQPSLSDLQKGAKANAIKINKILEKAHRNAGKSKLHFKVESRHTT